MTSDNSFSRHLSLPAIFVSFKAPGFKLFYLANTFASVDMNVRMAVHGWLVLELTDDSAVWLGIYALTLGMGQFIFSMLAGAIVDRFQRRNVLLIEGTLSALMALGLTVAIFYEVAGLWTALSLALVIGCLRAVRFTAVNRFVYDLVGPRQLVNGVSLWRFSSAPMMIFGALLVGALIEWFDIWAAYGFMGISLTIALPFLALIRVTGAAEKSNTNIMRQTVEGIKYAISNQSLRTLFTISIVMESLGFAFLVMIPVMAKNVLEAGPIGMGLLQAGVGAGMVISTLVMASRGDSENKPRVIFLNALIAGIALIGFAVSRSLVVSIFFAAVVMGFLNAYDLTLGALMQLVAPSNFRGRAVSLHSLAISFTAIGGFFMGIVGSVIGVPVILAAGGTGILINSLLRRPALIRIQRHQQQLSVEPTQEGSVSEDSD